MASRHLAQDGEGQPAGMGRGVDADGVVEGVPDQWLGAAEQGRPQELGAQGAWRHRVVVFVDDFGDDEVFIQVETAAGLELGGDLCGLGGGVLIERVLAPGLVDICPSWAVRTSEEVNTRSGLIVSRPASCSTRAGRL